MFDFHAHEGEDDSSAFISIVRRPMKRDTFTGEDTEYSLGILPWVSSFDTGTIAEMIEKRKDLSLGECGLDKRYPAIMEKQEKVFHEMLDIARSYDRMVVIHSVGRNDEIVKALLEHNIKRAVFHSFTSSYEMAKDITRHGWLISLGERALKVRDYKKLITLPFLLETDLSTGPLQKEKIKALYERVSEDTGIDQEERLDKLRLELWQRQKDSF